MREELKQLGVMGKNGAKANVLDSPDDLMPTLLILKQNNPDGEPGIEVVGLCCEKDIMPGLIRRTLEGQNALGYTLIMEAWATSFTAEAAKYDYQIRDMPADDKREIVHVTTVEKGNPKTQMSVANIERLSNGTRRLHEWVDSEDVESFGRFVITDW